MPDAPDDQRIVIDLLNHNPVAEGGRGQDSAIEFGSIIRSGELYQRILRFEGASRTCTV